MIPPRIWFCLETGDYWFGTKPGAYRDNLTLYRASDIRSPMDLKHAAQILADDKDAMADIAYLSGANEGRLHAALERFANKGQDT